MDNLSWFLLSIAAFVVAFSFIVKNENLSNKIKSSKWLMPLMLLFVVTYGITIKYLESRSLISQVEPVAWTLLALSVVVILAGMVVKKFSE